MKIPTRRGPKLVWGAILFLLLSTHTWADKVDDYVKRQMRRQHIPGLSLAVVKDGKVVKAKGYGLASVELNVPATKDTVYGIASVTKIFTATAIMVLVRDGKVGLDDSITNYLSGLPPAWHRITVRHLLTHTSGVKDYTGVVDLAKVSKSPVAPQELIKTVADCPLDFQPGEKYAYSSTGFCLLGLIIEKAGGKSYAEFMKERVFLPIGMHSTCVNDMKMVLTNRASGYAWHQGRLHNADYTDMSWPYAAGAMAASVADLVRWDATLDTEQLLPKDRWEQMWKPARLNDGTCLEYAGFGWGISDIDDRRVLTHFGRLPGFSAGFMHWIDPRITVIVLVNNENGRTFDIGLGIYRHYVPRFGKPIADTSPEITATLKAVLAATMAGTLDSQQFAENQRKEFFPHRAERFHSELQNVGEMKSFVLLERKDRDASQRYCYRAKFRKESILFTAVLDGGGKIESLKIEFE